ncbi:hypothetical protein CDAR_533821 [Caerostris darwini]|uniref:Uncharacterized protein n=1 Tax=Caerostris darwini TaxID=1538125 RepID=A0AAV4SC23_9ARAC|nr:hypothetical protein CDAR_533821 [Caerostris darwini]
MSPKAVSHCQSWIQSFRTTVYRCCYPFLSPPPPPPTFDISNSVNAITKEINSEEKKEQKQGSIEDLSKGINMYINPSYRELIETTWPSAPIPSLPTPSTLFFIFSQVNFRRAPRGLRSSFYHYFHGPEILQKYLEEMRYIHKANQSARPTPAHSLDFNKNKVWTLSRSSNSDKGLTTFKLSTMIKIII